MVASIFVRTLAGIQTVVAGNFSPGFTCPASHGVQESFTLLDYYIKIDPDCLFPMQQFVTTIGKTVWYNYGSSKAAFTIPFVAGVEVSTGDKFYVGDIECSIDYEFDQHVLPDGGAIVTLKSAGGETLWSETLVGNNGDSVCSVSLKALDGALRFDPDGTIITVIPEERWHNLISVVFVGIAAMYLVGDVNVLRAVSGKSLEAVPLTKKLFLIDGPLTSISACISLLVSDATSLTPDWLIMQQSIILFCACFYVIISALILFFGSRNEPVPFGTLRLAVELPILLAIFAPVVGSRGNLVYLSAFLTSVVSSLLVFRDTKAVLTGGAVTADSDFKILGLINIKYIHYAIVFVALFIQAPILMLSVITENQVSEFYARLLTAFVISFTVPLLAAGSR